MYLALLDMLSWSIAVPVRTFPMHNTSARRWSQSMDRHSSKSGALPVVFVTEAATKAINLINLTADLDKPLCNHTGR